MSARDSYKPRFPGMNKMTKIKSDKNPLKNKVLSKKNIKIIDGDKKVAVRNVTDYQQEDILITDKDDDENTEQKLVDKSDDISSLDLDKGVPKLQKNESKDIRVDNRDYEQYLSNEAYEVLVQQEIYRGKNRIIYF
jgi:hypothetical protein